MSACPQQVYFFQKGEKVLTMVQSSSINSVVLFSQFIPCKSEKLNTSLLGTEMTSLSLSPQEEEQSCCIVIFSASSSQSIRLYNFSLFRIRPFSQCPKGKYYDKYPIHLNRTLLSQIMCISTTGLGGGSKRNFLMLLGPMGGLEWPNWVL